MRKKLLLLVFLILLAIIFITREQEKKIFVKSEKDIKLYTDKDITRVDTLIENLYDEQKATNLPGIEKKYEVVAKKDTQFCDKEDNTFLVSKENGFNVITYQEDNDYYYYKDYNGKCDLIGKIENVNFTENIVETYANDSIYTSFESLSDFEVSGMVRVKKNEVIPFDSVNTRYTNPTSFSKGVLMIENNRNIFAFDKNDKKTTYQNNEKSGRRILAINKASDSLFMIVKKSNKYFLEAYDINNEDRIKKIEPNLSYDITKYYSNFDEFTSEVTTDKSGEYASFTGNGITLVVAEDFSKLFVLSNADTTLGIGQNTIYLKKEELYYIVNLSELKREHLGNIKALGFKTIGTSIYFTLLDNQGKEVYIKFTIR